jgi:hypothetical protein
MNPPLIVFTQDKGWGRSARVVGPSSGASSAAFKILEGFQGGWGRLKARHPSYRDIIGSGGFSPITRKVTGLRSSPTKEGLGELSLGKGGVKKYRGSLSFIVNGIAIILKLFISIKIIIEVMALGETC